MPAPKVVVVKPPPAPKTAADLLMPKVAAALSMPKEKAKAVDQMPFTSIRKTVAPAVSAANEPRPPGRIEKEPTPVVPVEPVKAKPKKSPVPHASSTARRHANRNARFNRTITDPTLKAWAEGAKAAALEARTKYETANPRPARKSTT